MTQEFEFQLDFGNSAINDLSQQAQQTDIYVSKPCKRVTFANQSCTDQDVIDGDVERDTTMHVVSECVRIGDQFTLFKRSYDDIQFQIMQQDDNDMEGESGNDLARIIQQHSATDLVPNVYEGGCKTWECSIDLCLYLYEFFQSIDHNHHGTLTSPLRVLEIGCGSALPSITCMQFGNQYVQSIDVQDYNKEVIEMVTMPNFLLNSRQLNERRCEMAASNGGRVPAQQDMEIDTRTVSDVSDSSIDGIALGFYAGDWEQLPDAINSCDNLTESRKYDLILGSEVMYCQENYHKLTRIMTQLLSKQGFALFSCKSQYFGCTGDLYSFKEYIQSQNQFHIETVFTSPGPGLSREIIKVTLL
ncbi:hypothetical protein MIR68_004484 [Amoeboaphelidium protococcarum]|nr:hypothetical protein MIR68_004484 [Amoeboaphelidium protococcarum]